MKEIMLQNGKITIVDDEDFERYSGFKWYSNQKGHVYRNGSQRKGESGSIYLHRDILGVTGKRQVDHINNNPLDNRKSNLRIVTVKQNLARVGKIYDNVTSKYKGVCWIKTAKAWQATIRVEGKQLKLGYFKTEDAAAHAYNEKAKEIHGEFAYLNDVPYDLDWKSKLIPNRREGVGKSKHIGVSYRPKYDDWQCHIMVNYKSIFLGTYKEEIEAAKAYNEAAIKYRGDKAKLNAIEEAE